MIKDKMVMTFPSSNIKEYPGYKDFMVSYWYLRKDNQNSRMFHVSYTTKIIRVTFEANLGSTKIEYAITKPFLILSDGNYLTPDLVNKWRLYTFRVTQNLSNTESTITIYIDLKTITYLPITEASLDSLPEIGIGGKGSNPLYGIVYEIWWHKDVSDVSELYYLILSSSSCRCGYGCVTSPTNPCLPSHDSTYNYQGYNCSPGCSQSCNVDFECLNNSKSECKYGLYDLESGNCLFYCPGDSCIFSTSLELTCNIGYKKVSDNPPACIPLRCTSYEIKDYKYICKECEVGYIPDSFGEFCICDTDFTGVSLDPVICVKIDKCSTYQKSDDKYICSSCLKGYSIDSEGNCKECESDYIKVLEDPFTCILTIESCNQYKLKENKLVCEVCEVGYVTTFDGVCIEDVEVCDSNTFLSDGSCAECPETCESCNVSEDKIECSECKQGYTLYEIEDEIVCMICSADNPICIQEANNNSETDSNSQENSEQLEDEEDDNSNQVKEESSSLSESMIVSQSHLIMQTFALVSLAVSIFSMNPNSFFGMLGTTQILGFILLYNLDIPNRVRTVIEGVNILQIVPNIFEYFIPDKKTLYEMRYNRAGYSSEYILISSGKFLSVLLSILLSCALVKLISKILNTNNHLQQYLIRIMHNLKVYLLMYLTQMHLELTVSSLMNLVNFSYRDGYSPINLVLSILISLICFYTPIKYFLYTIKHHNEIKTDICSYQFEALYSSLRRSDIDYLMLNTILHIRNLIYAINMIFLHKSSYIQVILNSNFSLSILLYQIIYKPYAIKRDNYINIFVEGCIFTTLSLLVFLISPSTIGDLYEAIEWSMILAIYSSIAIPVSINVIMTIIKLITKLKPKQIIADDATTHAKISNILAR
jgi:hypothetical protein